MHEQENVALIRETYAAFSAGDIQTILKKVDSSAEWVNHGPTTIPYAGNFTGRIPAFFQAIGESTTNGRVIADEFIAQGETVVVTGRYTATVNKTGAKLDTPVAHLFKVRNGKILKWVGYGDTAAVAAAHAGSAASSAR